MDYRRSYSASETVSLCDRDLGLKLKQRASRVKEKLEKLFAAVASFSSAMLLGMETDARRI